MLQTPTPARELKPRLVTRAQKENAPFEIKNILTLGSSEENHILLDSKDAHDRHAKIEERNQSYVLRDLRTRSGTFVNNTRVIEAILSDGDQIRIGDWEATFYNSSSERASSPLLNSKNEKWQKSLSHLPSFSATDFPVLLLGASGTGKERYAQLIHEFSNRRKAPFVSVNCSALSESLIESELFGHVRGSFTGATHDRKGAFEAARGGTLFLDEIGDFPIQLQPKLLRALENKEIRPVGSDKTIKTDVRIIAATHQNLLDRISEGAFRADLYFRLHVIRFNIPALRNRMEDFENLLFQFAKEFRVRFSQSAIESLRDHNWPGNIRELRNAISRAAAMFRGRSIEADDIASLIDPIPRSNATVSRGRTSAVCGPVIKEIERDLIIQRLLANHGNQRRTAFDLGMPKSTLHDRLKAYDIDIPKLLEADMLSV